MKITSLCTLEPDEIFKMVHYIEKFAKDDEDKREFALSHLGNFFIDLSFEQELELFTLIEREDYFNLWNFIKKNPTIKVNLDGDSKIEHAPGWKVKATALEASYTAAKNAKDFKFASQYTNARDLRCLREIKEYGYVFEKMKLEKEFKFPSNVENIKDYENIEGIDSKRLLGLVFEYIRKNPYRSKFFENIFYYLDLVKLDINRESEITQTFIKNAEELFEYLDSKKVNR